MFTRKWKQVGCYNCRNRWAFPKAAEHVKEKKNCGKQNNAQQQQKKEKKSLQFASKWKIAAVSRVSSENDVNRNQYLWHQTTLSDTSTSNSSIYSTGIMSFSASPASEATDVLMTGIKYQKAVSKESSISHAAGLQPDHVKDMQYVDLPTIGQNPLNVVRMPGGSGMSDVVAPGVVAVQEDRRMSGEFLDRDQHWPGPRCIEDRTGLLSCPAASSPEMQRQDHVAGVGGLPEIDSTAGSQSLLMECNPSALGAIAAWIGTASDLSASCLSGIKPACGAVQSPYISLNQCQLTPCLEMSLSQSAASSRSHMPSIQSQYHLPACSEMSSGQSPQYLLTPCSDISLGHGKYWLPASDTDATWQMLYKQQTAAAHHHQPIPHVCYAFCFQCLCLYKPVYFCLKWI